MCAAPSGSSRTRRLVKSTATLVFIGIALSSCSSKADRFVTLRPGDNVREIVASKPNGTVFTFMPGLYRRQQIVPKDNQKFIGQSGAILDGSMLLRNWQPKSGLWVSSVLPATLFKSGSCADRGNICQFREDLFVDDQLFGRVANKRDLGSRRWYYKNRRAYILDDPRDKKVELGVTEQAFIGNARGVTIRNLVVQKYAVRAQQGAIHPGERTIGWRIIDVTAQWNHGSGLRIAGRGLVVRGGRYNNNGQLGIGGLGVGTTLDRIEVAYNNYARYSSGWEAGGIKIVQSRSITITNSCIHNNSGPGIWFDTNNIDIKISNNKIFKNARMGIQYETSYSGEIINNTIAQNNTNGYDIWLWGSELLIQNSRDVLIRNNYIEIVNGQGIGIIQAKRGTGRYGPHNAINNRIVKNTIVLISAKPNILSGAAADYQHKILYRGRNVFNQNTYVVFRRNYKYWNFFGRNLTWVSLRENDLERNGRLILEKRQPSKPTC